MNVPTLPIFTLKQALPGSRQPLAPRLFDAPPVLQRFAERPEMAELEVATECAHGCLFCDHDHHDGLVVDVGVAQRLDQELSVTSDRPRAVLIGNIVDPCRPSNELQHEVAETVRVLARHGILARLDTRGMAGRELLDALTDCRHWVRVKVSMTTLERGMYRVLEPNAALPEERLEMIAELLDRDVPVDVAIDPLVPHLTDAPSHLRSLLESLADAGVRQVTTSYLVLRHDTRVRMQSALDTLECSEIVFGAFSDGPALRDGSGTARFLSKAKRQRGYANVMAIAAELGITARIDGANNPDFRAPRPEAAHHLRSLQQTFRGNSHAAPSPDRTGT